MLLHQLYILYILRGCIFLNVYAEKYSDLGGLRGPATALIICLID